jgi:polyisoprenoid-binding protein YceI
MATSTLTAPSGTAVWKLDPAHAHVEFAVRHLMISRVKGQFSEVEGTVRIDGDDVTSAELEVQIDASSIDTRVDQRDEHLRSADFLDVEHFPNLKFHSTSVERTGEDTLKVTGHLTIRDVTREVVLDVTERGTAKDPWGGQRAGFGATTKIDRKEFGLTWNQALETGGVLVGDEVSINIDAELVLESE